MPFLNISTYRFVELADLPALRARLEASAEAAGVKGTVLIAHEGINLFMAGEEPALRHWVATALHAEPPFAGLPTKDSFSDTMPFKRLKVKIKNELIRMNHPTIAPQQGRAPSVEPAALARWLAQGHDDAGRAVGVERDLPEVLQLEGGILGYFAASNGVAPGWRGECFVFDERRTVAADLAPGDPPPCERAAVEEGR
jgi:predicted sulfurtransferase